MKPKLIYSFLCILTLLSYGCKKENDELHTLLLGKWQYISRITSWTTTNPSNNVKTVIYDTLTSVPDENFYLEFKQDILKGQVKIGNHITHWSDNPYTKNSNDLTFYSNPFTTDNTPDTEFRTTTINHLSKNKLVLSDVDTLRPSPLVMVEVWFDFKR